MRYRNWFAVLTLAAIVTAAPILAAAPVTVSGATIGGSKNTSPGDVAAGVLGGLLAVGMAIRVKDAATVARKWATRAASASGDYAAAVKEAGADWEANTIAGAENYAQGVTQSIGDRRYEKGVREAGQGKYVARASTLGSQRFAPGVQASEADMARGVAPVLETIRSINLPPRRPKGDPGNMERANAVAMALRKLKTGR